MKLIGMMLLTWWSCSIWGGPRLFLAPVNHLYIPEGFDNNDSVEVVVTGMFSNLCFSRNNVSVDIRDNTIELKVTALAPEVILMEGMFCPEMDVPFKEVISIGNLSGGDYEIRVNEKARQALNGRLRIAEASSQSVDENLYAGIESIEVKDPKNIVLHGWLPSDCLELDKIKLVNNARDTVSVLPILKKVKDVCDKKEVTVAYSVNLEKIKLKSKKILLHVRTMDGKSVNTILNSDL